MIHDGKRHVSTCYFCLKNLDGDYKNTGVEM